MYYEQSGSKTFMISLVTSLVVSIIINVLFLFISSNSIIPKFGSTFEIPNLKGLDIETARQIIESKGLSFVIEKEVEDPIVERGKIAFQNPTMGSKLRRGDIVKVIVSKGPPSSGGEIIIPVLTGLTLSQAKVRIAESKLTIGTITMEVSDKPESTVIRTIPSEGERVSENFPVNIVISLGRGETIVPKITGLSITQAKRKLEEAGLLLGNTTTVSDPEYSFDVIIRQNPPVGTPVKKGTKVDITVNVEEY